MKKLDKPMMSVKEILTDISNTVRDIDKKKNIIDAIRQVEYAAIEYDNLATNHDLHLIEPSKVTGTHLDANDMIELYTKKFSRNKLKSKYYDKIMASKKDGRCPICGVGQISNLDHYLAKTLYPLYAITPTNLTPMCRDCNFKKLDRAITSYVNAPLHPYYDDIDDIIWLSAKIVKKPEGNIVAEYFVDPAINGINSDLYTRIDNHCKTYKLFELFSIQACTEIAESIAMWQNIASEGGNDKLKIFFKGCLESRETCQKNTWHTALLRALIDNVEIVL